MEKSNQEEWTPEVKVEYEQWLDENMKQSDYTTLGQSFKHDIFEWGHDKYENGEEYYALDVKNERLAIIEGISNPALQFFEIQKGQLSYKDYKTQDWKYEENLLPLEKALDKGEGYALDYLERKRQNPWEAALKKAQEQNLGKESNQQIEKQRDHTNDWDR